MTTIIATSLVQLAVSILKWWAEREDIKGTERARLALEASEKIYEALRWGSGAAASPGGGAELRSGPATIRIPGLDPDPPGPAAPDPLRGPGEDPDLYRDSDP